jgi:hypothetical protein
MTLTILRGKAVVTTVTLTYDNATWTPFEGEEELARVLRGTFRLRTGRVLEDGKGGTAKVGIVETLKLCSRSSYAAYDQITRLGYEVEDSE